MRPSEHPEWRRLRHHIEDAVEHTDTHTIEDIEAGLDAGLFQFHTGRESVVVTQIEDYPRLRVCNFYFLGGNMDELMDEIEPRLVAWAREVHGCKRVYGSGRLGWSRVLPHYGYARDCIIMCKEIG